ncbi:hypothetical protein KGF56_003912 [Candida oxycetoniae]|uniref:Uncharacterized protein n=1 Tax=Candida oxycetoniae TaxID=497107 RepID=A0AAI9WWV2_9ASCO|nr:uncharacterized protein KGF56_003912 [Candida oxycetoniae]KAI3403324.2 hypothetical protein KGF56_003912 [Candida oxycetoniae]
MALPSPYEYSAVFGLMRLLQYQNNYPALGSGSHALSTQARNLLGPRIPKVVVDFQTAVQFNLFGSYPFHKDVAPSAVFTALFSIVFLCHLAIFSINCYRGHYFWPQLGFIFYSLCRVLGFALRIVWSADLSQTSIGITGEVFLILPTVLLPSFNLILAQRIFTWRHPVGGSRRLFWNLMLTLYAIVAGVVAMTIVASAGINIYLLGAPNYARFVRCIQATSVLIIVYSLTALSLIGLAFFFKPTTKDENLYTYQPWWIESFAPTYFVRKGVPQEAAESFLKRNHNHRFAIRVIAATHHHYKMVKGLSNERGDLTHNTSLLIIAITTIIILIGAILRCVVCFQARMMYDRSPVGSAAMMYVWWGGFEIVTNMLYLIGRIDLRFYRPDRLPKHIKHIKTAEQSLYPSEIESMDLDEHGRLKNTESYEDHTSKEDEDEDEEEEEEDGNFYFDGEQSEDEEDDFDFAPNSNMKEKKELKQMSSEKPPMGAAYNKTEPPYPDTNKSDTESEFNF